MAGKSDTFENDLLKLIFQATAIANVADNAASSPLTNLYVALHTADPTDAGVQNASEATYTGYARVAVARSAGGWTVTGSSVSPAAAISFGACTAGTNTITHWSVGVASSGVTFFRSLGGTVGVAVMGAALAAVAGVMYLLQYGVVNFADGFVPGVKAVVPGTKRPRAMLLPP